VKCSLLLSDCTQNYKVPVRFGKTVQCLVLLKPTEPVMWLLRTCRDILKRTCELLKITFANTPDIIPCAL
jgi:hypothetical protein